MGYFNEGSMEHAAGDYNRLDEVIWARPRELTTFVLQTG